MSDWRLELYQYIYIWNVRTSWRHCYPVQSPVFISSVDPTHSTILYMNNVRLDNIHFFVLLTRPYWKAATWWNSSTVWSKTDDCCPTMPHLSHCPLTRRNITSFTVVEPPTLLHSLTNSSIPSDSWILSVSLQKCRHSMHKRFGHYRKCERDVCG